MRKALLTLTALAGLLGAGVLTTASAAPRDEAAPLVQTVQFYGGGYRPYQADWREREWRHHEWERHRRWEEWHRVHAFRGW